MPSLFMFHYTVLFRQPVTVCSVHVLVSLIALLFSLVLIIFPFSALDETLHANEVNVEYFAFVKRPVHLFPCHPLLLLFAP